MVEVFNAIFAEHTMFSVDVLTRDCLTIVAELGCVDSFNFVKIAL